MAMKSWSSGAQLLALVRAEPGITRAVAAQRMGVGSGAATDLVARLRAARLVDEAPAPAQGRGRPTTVLLPHPDGPLVIAAELRSGDWRLAVAGIDGRPSVVASGARRGLRPLLAEMADAIRTVHEANHSRIQAVSVSVAGTVSDDRLVQFTTRGWRDVGLSALVDGTDLPLLLGNDATLAGLAEARSGSARGAGTALHLLVAVGLGGTLIVDGEPVVGAHGAAGEYGHVPFGDRSLQCPCGARGCWDLDVDGRALARHLGEPEPDDPVEYAHRVLGDSCSARAIEKVCTALGFGVAGLVNLHDPEVVTLGGLAIPLRAAAPAAFSAAYDDGLMAFRKQSAPEVRDGVHGEDGPLYGAALRGVDFVTSEAALARWAQPTVELARLAGRGIGRRTR